MKILIIGGTGNISWWCTAEALAHGHEVWILNRAATRLTRRKPPVGVQEIHVDINTPILHKIIRNFNFDVVANFICFNAQQARENIRIFQDHTNLFLFISSEAIYQRKSEYLPFKESAPQHNSSIACSYIEGKIQAEEEFLKAQQQSKFPVAIIRPGYTYDTILPVSLGHNCFTAPQRALDGKAFLIGGNGNNQWTFTHSQDFASAFVSILKNPKIIGEAIHIISNFIYSWNEAMLILADTLCLKNPRFLHIPPEAVMASDLGKQKEVAESRMLDAIFDNSKIKSLAPEWRAKIPLEEGLRLTLDWLYEDPRRIRIVPTLYQLLDELERQYDHQ